MDQIDMTFGRLTSIKPESRRDSNVMFGPRTMIMMREMARLLIAVILLAGGQSSASAQSFNCRYAKKSAEVAICKYENLGRLDEEMASLYYGLSEDEQEEINPSQARWLRRRNACGFNYDCIEEAYRRRILFLSNY
jgi:uncharacterized protein